MTLRTRIAPTPSGFLHAGNGIAFIITYAIARAFHGKILLRIDDLDAERMRPEYVEDIFKTLEWLGLDYDEGPNGVEDFLKNHSQYTRLDLYKKTLEILKNTEGMLYACNCSRKMIKEQSIKGIYPQTCRSKNLDFDEKDIAWRIKLPENPLTSFQEFQKPPISVPLATTMGDFIVRQKNEMPAYQIASLVDDTYFNINFIVRGKDLLNSTAAQVFLSETFEKLGEPTNFHKNTFFHHDLLTDTEGVKLSKSQGAGSLKDWRENHRLPTELYQKAGKWLGFKEDFDSLEDLKDVFKTYIESKGLLKIGG